MIVAPGRASEDNRSHDPAAVSAGRGKGKIADSTIADTAPISILMTLLLVLDVVLDLSLCSASYIDKRTGCVPSFLR
jgi:hypothetical protein